jgi:hypothetical protein
LVKSIGFYRFTVGKPLPMGCGFYLWNGFVNRGWRHSPCVRRPTSLNFLKGFTGRTTQLGAFSSHATNNNEEKNLYVELKFI